MSNITKNGFYKLQKLDSSKITIQDNLVVSFFDYLNQEIEIEIGNNSKVEFYSVLKNREDTKISFIQNKQNSDLKVRCLLLSKDDEKVKAKISSEISANHVKSDVKIISIIGNNGFVDIDGVIKINKGVLKVDGNLSEENLFLGNSGKVKGIPTLLVRSDDVKASHSCKMERISDDKLFYLRSRGVARDNALSMMIEAQIKNLFSCLSMLDNDFYEELIDNILLKIK